MVKDIVNGACHEVGRFTYDAANHELRDENAKLIHLTGKKLRIFEVLIENYPNWLSLRALHSAVWSGESADLHAASVHLCELKKILVGEIVGNRTQGYKLRDMREITRDDRNELHPSWGEVCKAAKEVGQYVFGEFRANAVLTFAGHSAIFANLVLVNSLSRAKLLNMPVYLALQRDWDSSKSQELPTLPGYEAFPGEAVALLVPRVLIDQLKEAKNRIWRIAVIDDAIISAAVPTALKTHLNLPRKARMEFACYVGYRPVIKAMKAREPEKVVKWLQTEEELDKFRLPCDTPLLWFGQLLPSDAKPE